MLSRKIVIIDALRTPVGRFGGSLASLSPVQLAAPVARKLISLLPAEAVIDEVIVGSILTAGHGMNIARQIALGAGLPQETPALTINQMCGSGLRAITLAAERQGSDVVLSVTDEGAGIPPEERERVLAPFYRLDKARTPEGPAHGFGLGLTLAHRVAVVHGGHIVIGPANGHGGEHGCRVSLILPAGC